MRLLYGQGPIRRALESIVTTLEGRVGGGEQGTEDVDPLFEAIHPLRCRWERDAKFAMFRLVPRGADGAFDATRGQVIDRDDFRGQHGRVSVCHTSDERAEPHAGRLASESGEQCPRLQRRPLRICVERLEVVEEPDAIESRILGEPSARNDLFPCELMLRHVQTESHVIPSSVA